MPVATQSKHCTALPGTPASATLALTVLSDRSAGIRKSKNGPRRAAVLIAVHVLILAHLLHWYWKGRTVSPVEPSEAMYTLNQGYLNAGFFFFALAILSTLIFGRFFCGWGCHLVAYQDLCGWFLKKIGIKPKPFRSRLLVLAPLALAIYMFVWPTVYRVLVGIPAPTITNHLVTDQFWKTFPGVVIAIITFAVCGFAIVYFLGAKGFCTYACPYGGFFGLTDKAAIGRILVTDDCEQCGHCTAVCTSNVRVHEEVAKFGMVVDPGCMKCMDCVSVCPNDALYFGFANPLKGNEATRQQGNKAKPSRDREGAVSGFTNRQSTIDNRKSHYDFTLTEELLMVVIGLGALLAFRGLYGQIPLLLAMGMAAITSFVFIKFIHLIRHANLRLQNLQLKRGGDVSGAGWVFAACSAILFLFVMHSGVVQWELWRGKREFLAAKVGDEVWLPGANWWQSASNTQRAAAESAVRHFERGQRIGFLFTPAALQYQVQLYLAIGDTAGAEASMRKRLGILPDDAESHRWLAAIFRLQDKPIEAEQAYRRALELDRSHDAARSDLANLLVSQKRWDDAVRVLQDGASASPPSPRWQLQSASVFSQRGVERLQQGARDAGMQDLRDALAINPNLTQTRYNLALALLSIPVVSEAIEHLQRVVREKPDMAEAHYNLAVAIFMSGRPADAIPVAREALRLAPDDQQAQQFLQMLLKEQQP